MGACIDLHPAGEGRELQIRAAFDAILCLLRTGCQSRMPATTCLGQPEPSNEDVGRPHTPPSSKSSNLTLTPIFAPGRLRRRFRAEIASEPLVGAGRFSDSACPFATEALSDGIGSGVLSSVADGGFTACPPDAAPSAWSAFRHS